MIEEKIDQLLNELCDGSYILICKIKQDGGWSSITWKKLPEAMIISILEKTKHDLLSDIYGKQNRIRDDGDDGNVADK